MAVEFPFPYEFFLIGPALLGLGLLMVRVVPPVVRARRQAAYERVASSELSCLELAVPGSLPADPQRAVELVRALHPRQRRGVDRWAVGWPPVELRVVWRDGQLAWQLQGGRQTIAAATSALRTVYPTVDAQPLALPDAPAVASAVGRLVAPSSWPLGEPEATSTSVLARLASELESSFEDADVRLRLLARPIAPETWRRALHPDEQQGRSFGSIVGEAVIDTVFNRPSSVGSPQPVTLTAAEREARQRKRAARVGFEVGLLLEVANADAAAAKAILWRLVDFTDALGDGRQAIAWQIRPGSISAAPRARLGDWELAQLWHLPDEAFDRAGLSRQRAMAAPAPRSAPASRAAVKIGDTRSGPLVVPISELARHLAVFGATGSGKSTLLLNLALGLLETPMGANLIDPHGDLAADILSRIPRQHEDRVRVLRLADRAHPRGFNFLERHADDDAQLVTSEFVGLFSDLWPDYTGPKMQHYMRHALLTLLSADAPQTVLELVRILTDDAFRAPYVAALGDPMLAAFWRNEWPSPASREKDTSIKAILNKLGAFVSYHSIRHVVGQGVSTIRPRDVMDAGDLLVVDLSRVGADNASLFGAMLISRYYIDAIGRQGTPTATRRPHALLIDEVQRFATRAIDKIGVEGRKFGLTLGVASQSLKGLNERLRETILTNAATLVVLDPGSDDLGLLRRLFAPLSAEELLGLRRYEFVVRTPAPDGRSAVYGAVVPLPPPGEAERANALILASDARDARPLEEVRAEVLRRTSPPTGTHPGDGGDGPNARTAGH
jgi:hypothetical protein